MPRRPSASTRRRLGQPGVGITKGDTVMNGGARTGTVLAVVKGAAWVRWPHEHESWHYLHTLRRVES